GLRARGGAAGGREDQGGPRRAEGEAGRAPRAADRGAEPPRGLHDPVPVGPLPQGEAEPVPDRPRGIHAGRDRGPLTSRGHFFAVGPRTRSAMISFWISFVPSYSPTMRASRKYRSTSTAALTP